jgi:glycosyltransferase involved in cell wall biosynthesis
MVRQRFPLIVIMPVYEDRPSASALIKDLAVQCGVLPYVIAVEDGSIRDPLPISSISGAGLSGEILYLSRNMGHQRAIATGLAYVAANFEAEAVVVMDSDGEDRPESIAALVEELKRPDIDAVVAQRRKRSEKFSFRAFYVVYRMIFQMLTGRTIRFGNFTALSARAVRRLAAMQELWVHFAASLMVSRLRIGAVATDRGLRYAGKSQMNFVSLSLHGLRSIMVFAEDVLVRVGMFCAALAGVAVFLLALTLFLKLIGFATPGWFSTASGILIIILMQSGILMFTTLMVSGIVRSAPPLTFAQIDLLIDRVEKTDVSVARSLSLADQA